MKGKEFGLSRLFLLIGSIFGIVAFFRPFYQIDALLTRPSAYDLILQAIKYSETQEYFGFLNNLLIDEFTSNPALHVPVIILLLIPILFGIVGLELLIRSVVLRLKIVHRGWVFIILSFIGIVTGLWLSQQQEVFDFYFFESVRAGYWQSLTMVIFSLLAKFTD